jgi:hypothetical protein
MTRPSATRGKQSVPGPQAVAGALLTQAAVRVTGQDRLPDAIAGLLPGRPLQPGTTAPLRVLPPDALQQLIPSAAVVAAGLDPARTTAPAPPVLWEQDGARLLIRVAEVRAQLSTGLVEMVVPVTCDQTGDADVTVTFLTGSTDRPAGGIATTEDHPRGPAVVVEGWAEPIIAFAWQTLVVATSALSNAGGDDLSGRDLVTAALDITADGMTVTPMGRHTFYPQA